jgi:hypothetical protein
MKSCGPHLAISNHITCENCFNIRVTAGFFALIPKELLEEDSMESRVNAMIAEKRAESESELTCDL